MPEIKPDKAQSKDEPIMKELQEFLDKTNPGINKQRAKQFAKLITKFAELEVKAPKQHAALKAVAASNQQTVIKMLEDNEIHNTFAFLDLVKAMLAILEVEGFIKINFNQ